MMNLDLIFPEIFLSLSIMFLLMIGVFKKNSEKLVYNLSIMFLLVLGVFKNESSKITFNLSLLAILITAIITINETFSVTDLINTNNTNLASK